MRENRLRARACCRVRSGIDSGASRAAAVDAYYEPKTPLVICDTRDQIMQVLDAVRGAHCRGEIGRVRKSSRPEERTRMSLQRHRAQSCSERANMSAFSSIMTER
jgi:hypothetical protein